MSVGEGVSGPAREGHPVSCPGLVLPCVLSCGEGPPGTLNWNVWVGKGLSCFYLSFLNECIAHISMFNIRSVSSLYLEDW